MIRKTTPNKEAKIRLKKCAIKTCRALFEPRSSWAKCCGPACAMALCELERARKLRKERQVGLEKLKRKADYVADAQKAINAWVRLRDKDLPCICCGKMPTGTDGVGGQWDAGHYLSRGSHPHLRFDERNIFRQRKGCNRPGGTTAASFRLGVIARIGLAAVEALEADNTPRHYTIEALKAIKALYDQKYKELKNGN